MKGFLTWHDRPFRKTHNLVEVGEACATVDATLEAQGRRRLEFGIGTLRLPGYADATSWVVSVHNHPGRLRSFAGIVTRFRTVFVVGAELTNASVKECASAPILIAASIGADTVIASASGVLVRGASDGRPVVAPLRSHP